MSREHKISTKEILKFLSKNEWVISGVRGSHYILRKSDLQLQVPLRKELGKKTIVSTVERAGFKIEDLYRDLGFR